MTDGLRKSHLRKAPQVGLSEVGLPDIYQKVKHLAFLQMVGETHENNFQCTSIQK